MSTVHRVWRGVVTVTETFENIPRTGKRCVWDLLDNRSEMERFDWSDFFAVLAVTYGTAISIHIVFYCSFTAMDIPAKNEWPFGKNTVFRSL